MIYKGLSFEFLSNIHVIPTEFRIIWSDFVLDARTVKAGRLKQFAEKYELWGDMRGNLGTHSDAFLKEGSNSSERVKGTTHNDFLFGHEGNDKLIGNAGADFLVGGEGNDILRLGGGFFNRGKGGDGDDMIRGGSGIDWVHGNAGNDIIRMKGGDDKGYGGDGHDKLFGGTGRDWLQGANGNDTLHGGAGNDTLHGGNGNDLLEDRKGRDWLDGGAGNDTLISRSDAGAPDMTLDEIDHSTEDFSKWNDRLTGGSGADEFRFIYEMNSSKEIAARHLNADGSVNWMGVMTENGAPHAHWVDWGGRDRIEDFNAAEGDTIVLEGHTVAIDDLVFLDTDSDGFDDSTLITVFSDQMSQMAMMGMSGMPMAHDRDFLGFILVENMLISESDITLDAMSMAARFDFI